MSAGPTDRSRRGILLALAAALAAAPSAAAPARAQEAPPPAGPVFFRNPDAATARDIADAISLFGDPSPNIKEGARNLLHDIGWWSVSRLLDSVKERQGQFRTNAYLVLGRLGDRRAIPALRAEVGESSEWPPAVAALMLGRMRDAEDPTLAAFSAALRPESGNHLRRQAVCLALARLHRLRAPACVPLLRDALAARSANPAVHHAALLALGFFRSSVVEALPDGSGFQPSRPIADALKDRDTGRRHSAVLAMAVSHIDSFHPLFVETYLRDGDRQVRLVALLALGRNRDPATTVLLAKVLESPAAPEEEKQMAAYLLGRRPELLASDPRAFDALVGAVTAPRAPEVAAASLLALASVDDPRVAKLLVSRLAATSATVRAAAAVGSVRLRRDDDLRRVRDEISARLKAGEQDDNARFDMKAAVDEIGAVLRDRADVAAGQQPKPRAAVKWREAEARDLFLEQGRDERQRVFDFVNLRALQVLGIDGVYPYRPSYDPDQPAESLGGVGTKGISVRPDRPVKNEMSDQYDVRVELSRRPYFSPAEDDPDAAPAAVPRETK